MAVDVELSNRQMVSSNFLSLNPSKTEFLVIGLPKQLDKLNYPIIHLPNDAVAESGGSRGHVNPLPQSICRRGSTLAWKMVTPSESS